MKNRTLLQLALFLLLFTSVKAQNPIPSYDVPVYGQANFQELTTKLSFTDNLEKKDILVKTTCGGGTGLSNGNIDLLDNSTDSEAGGDPATCTANVWIYSLDGTTIYGPYFMYGGDILRLTVDDREWGVYVESNDHVTVDVWIE